MKKHHYIRTALAAGFIVLTSTAFFTPAFADDNQAETFAPSLQIENFIGRMTIVNGETVSITGEVDGTVAQDKNSWHIDGGEVLRNSHCRKNKSRIEVSFGSWNWLGRSGGYKNLSDYPHLKITLPAHAHLKISDSIIFGDSENLGTADISLDHCSDLVLGTVTGDFTLDISGSADVKAQNIGTGDISIHGSGDVLVADVEGLDLVISGSGDFDAGYISGKTTVSVNGSGDVDIEHIQGGLDYRGNGSGDIDVDSLNGALDYSNHGSGDIVIDKIYANVVDVSLNGSGDAALGAGKIGRIYVSTHGSGGVTFRGDAGDVDVRTRGSSDVFVRTASGEVKANVQGSSDVKINGVRYKRN